MLGGMDEGLAQICTTTDGSVATKQVPRAQKPPSRI
jgi:hypothetical protein